MVRFRVRRAVLIIALAPPALMAQSREPFSIQATGAYLFPTTASISRENKARSGWEVQLRYTWSRASLGVGYQRSAAFLMTLDAPGHPETRDVFTTDAVSVFFVEPRVVVAAERTVASYLSGRVGLWRPICVGALCDRAASLGLGGGLGILVRLGAQMTADVGAQYYSTRIDRGRQVPSVTVGYIVGRLGLSIGLRPSRSPGAMEHLHSPDA